MRIEEGKPTMVNVPPDGWCFFHCLVACRDLATRGSGARQIRLGGVPDYASEGHTPKKVRAELTSFMEYKGVFSKALAEFHDFAESEKPKSLV